MPAGSRDCGIVVGVAAMAMGWQPGSHLVTYALGSCIGVAAFDPVARVGAILHFMLPGPPGASADAVDPFLYATTGIPAMFEVLGAAGAQQQRLVVCAAGGAAIVADAGVVMIGQRNGAMLRQILRQQGLELAAADLGGRLARTMTLDVTTGVVVVRAGGAERILWAADETASTAVGNKPGTDRCNTPS